MQHYAFERGPRLGNISQQDTDAIVNSTDRELSDSSAISSAIHHVAGSELLAACHQLGECALGDATITPGFKLPAQWVIHTVCPSWRGGKHDDEQILAKCYRSCLEVDASHGIHSITFPAIGCGALGFPTERAARITFETADQFLASRMTIGTVRFVCFDEGALSHYNEAFSRAVNW